MEKKELMAELEGLKSTLETSINEKAKAEIAEQLKSIQADVNAKLADVATNDSADAVKAMAAEVAKVKADLAATVSGLQILESRTKSSPKSKATKVSFDEAFTRC